MNSHKVLWLHRLIHLVCFAFSEADSNLLGHLCIFRRFFPAITLTCFQWSLAIDMSCNYGGPPLGLLSSFWLERLVPLSIAGCCRKDEGEFLVLQQTVVWFFSFSSYTWLEEMIGKDLLNGVSTVVQIILDIVTCGHWWFGV